MHQKCRKKLHLKSQKTIGSSFFKPIACMLWKWYIYLPQTLNGAGVLTCMSLWATLWVLLSRLNKPEIHLSECMVHDDPYRVVQGMVLVRIGACECFSRQSMGVSEFVPPKKTWIFGFRSAPHPSKNK